MKYNMKLRHQGKLHAVRKHDAKDRIVGEKRSKRRGNKMVRRALKIDLLTL